MQIETLLKEVIQINNKFEQIDRITGKSFNLFVASGIGHKELVHENFIVELLDVNGSHKQGDIFLKLFLKEIDNKKIKVDNPEIYSEYVISDNRRIDIVIKPNRKLLIAIEMKIYARDQDTQLSDYYTYLKEKEKCDFELFYLTLFEDDVSSESKCGLILDKDYKLISFKYHVLPWIEKCINQVAEIMFLRDALIQYKILLKNLTNSNVTLGDEIMKVIAKDKDSIKAASDIVKNYSRTWAAKEKEFFVEIYTSVNKQIKNWEDGDSSYFNLWYDNDNNAYHDEKVVDEFEKKIDNNKERGICFIKEYNNVFYYVGVAWFSNGDLYLLVAKKTDTSGTNEFSSSLDELLLPLEYEKYEKDNSYFKVCNPKISALNTDTPSFELFDKSILKKLAKKISQELVELIKKIEKDILS